LNAEEQTAYLDVYRSIISEHYPVQRVGKVLRPFPRVFIVATKT